MTSCRLADDRRRAPAAGPRRRARRAAIASAMNAPSAWRQPSCSSRSKSAALSQPAAADGEPEPARQVERLLERGDPARVAGGRAGHEVGGELHLGEREATRAARRIACPVPKSSSDTPKPFTRRRVERRERRPRRAERAVRRSRTRSVAGRRRARGRSSANRSARPGSARPRAGTAILTSTSSPARANSRACAHARSRTCSVKRPTSPSASSTGTNAAGPIQPVPGSCQPGDGLCAADAAGRQVDRRPEAGDDPPAVAARR